MLSLIVIYGVLFVVWLANHTVGTLLMIGVGLYLADCTLRVRIACRRCDGDGKILQRGRVFSLCPMCRGRKHHVRIGSRIWRRNRYLFRDDPEDTTERAPSLHDRGWR